MTTATAEGTTYAVGDRLDSATMRDNLPVGTILRGGQRVRTLYRIELSEGGERMRRVIEGTDGGHRGELASMSGFRTDGWARVESLPEQETGAQAVSTRPEWMQVGYAIQTAEEWRALPEGTVVRGRNGQTYEAAKHPDREEMYLATRRTPEGDPSDALRYLHGIAMTNAGGWGTIVSLPEEGPVSTAPKAGDRLARKSHFEALPVGSIIARLSNSSEQWRRDLEDDTSGSAWVYIADPALTCSVRGFSPYRGWEVVQSGPPVVTTRVGDRLAGESAFRELPPGAVLTSVAGDEWIIDDDHNIRRNRDGHRRLGRSIRHSNYRLTRLATSNPEVITMHGEVPDPEGTRIEMVPETLCQYQQRFYTTAWGNALHAGVTTDYHDTVMENLGAEPDTYQTLSLGMAVFGCDSTRISALPNGAVLTSGDPRVLPWHRLAQVENSVLLHLLGSEQSQYTVYHVASGQGLETQPWASEEWTPEHLGLVAEWKIRAEERGRRLQSSRSWCGEYARAIARTGIWREDGWMSSPMPRPEDYLTAEQVAALPQHTILMFEARSQHCWVVRDDRMTNPCRTRSLGGSIPGDWAEHGLRVWCRHDQRLHIPVLDSLLVHHLPIGGRVRYGDEDYTKQANLYLTRGSSTYQSFDLTHHGHTRVVGFPNYEHPAR